MPTLVDADGAEMGQLPAETFSGDLEVPKPELTKILHRLTESELAYICDDSLTTLTQHDTGVAVDLYKERNTVERLINKLKAWRGIATR